MSKRTLLLSALTAITVTAMGATGAIAGQNTPTSESMTDPKIGPAHDKVAEGLGTQSGIQVEANNLDWDHAKPTTLSLAFHIEAKTAKQKWYILASYVYIGIAPITDGGYVGICCGDLDTNDFNPYSYAQAMDVSSTHRHVNEDVWWTLQIKEGDDGIPVAARNACRKLRKDLEKQGLSREEIFGQDRTTVLNYDFRYAAAVAYMDPHHFGQQEIYWKQSQPTWRQIGVTCLKHVLQVSTNPDLKPGGSGDLAAAFQVNQAALAITPKHHEAKCPAKLHLNPTIEATGKGTVKYRIVDQLGNKSRTFEVKFDKSDVKFLDHVIELDGKGKPKGLGFAAAPQQSDKLGYVAASDPNLAQGYFQVEVIEPHKKLSNIADYSIKCTVRTVGDGEMTAPKDTVNPAIVGGLTSDLPDLYIDSVQPSPAVPTKLFIKITNTGIGASKPTNLKAIRWTGNQSTARGTAVPAIQAGQSQVILAELGGTIDGATQLYVRVDDPNRIPEKDESNNSFKVK